jgi:hypothetical protein
MKKLFLILSAILLLAVPVNSQEDPQNTTYSKSYTFTGKLNRSVPYVAQDGSAVQEVQNMVRSAPGVPVGWKPRQGYIDHNSTTLGAYQVKSLHHFIQKDMLTDVFIAQANDNLYLAGESPPCSTCTTFGSSVIALDSSAGVGFGDQIGDDWIFAAQGTAPIAWSGGTAYPDAVLIDRAGTAVDYHNGYEKVRNNDTDLYITWAEDDTADVYIGFRRRIDGVYIDMVSGSENDTEANVTVKARRSGSWTGVSGLSDGTDTAPDTFAKSGLISWTASALDEPYVLPGTTHHLFWYLFEFDADLDDDIQVYRVRITEDAQKMTNLWSGRYLSPVGVVLETADGFENFTYECTDGSQVAYMDVGEMTDSYAFYVGFSYPAFGIGLQIDPENSNIDTAASVTVSYWNAVDSAWTSVGTVSDGTMSGTYSLNHSGIMQWDGEAIKEDKRILADIPISLYWYKIAFSATLPADVHIWDIAETQKPDTLINVPEYEGVIENNGRAFYWPGYIYKSGIDYSEEEFAYILNGPRAGSTGNIFGPGVVNAATRLHSFLVVSTKNPYRIYLLEGKVPSSFDELLLSSTIGVLAPKSLITIEDNVRLFTSERNVHAAIFLSHDGVYLCDGMTVINISQPIADLFDDSSAPYIEMSTADDSYAWIDYSEKTVHIAVPINTTGTGTQSTLNREIVYSYLSNEWYDQVVRQNPLSCGLDVIDSNGERLPYYGDYTGYVYRGEGSDDSGTAITSYLKTADFTPFMGQRSDALNYIFDLRSVKAKYNAQSSGTISVTLYPDGYTSGYAMADTMSLTNSGYTFAQDNVGENKKGESVAIKFQSTGIMELFGYTIDFQPVRETQE